MIIVVLVIYTIFDPNRRKINLKKYLRVVIEKEPSQSSRSDNYADYLGMVGESRVARELLKLRRNNRIIRNVILGNNDKSTEIDIVYITDVGIYVLEVKNFSGWIFGNINHKNWTETFRTGNYYFQNPFNQNQSHINALKYTLSKHDKVQYHSVVVFSDESTFKVVPTSSDVKMIIKTSDIVRMISASIEYNRTLLINDEKLTDIEIDEIYEALLPKTKYSILQREHHVRNAHNTKYGIKQETETYVEINGETYVVEIDSDKTGNK